MGKNLLRFVLFLFVCLPISVNAAPFSFSDDFSDSATLSTNWTELFSSEAVMTTATGTVVGTPNGSYDDTFALAVAGPSLQSNSLFMTTSLSVQPVASTLDLSSYGFKAGMFFGLDLVGGSDANTFIAGIDLRKDGSSNLFLTLVNTDYVEGTPPSTYKTISQNLAGDETILDLAIENGVAYLTLYDFTDQSFIEDISYDLTSYASVFGSVGIFSTGIGTFDSFDVSGEDNTAPVPEPSTILLLGSGLAGLAFYRRKRK